MSQGAAAAHGALLCLAAFASLAAIFLGASAWLPAAFVAASWVSALQLQRRDAARLKRGLT